VRVLLGLVRKKRRSGGSTITQQLVRILFIVDQSKIFRRKIIESLLAICFNRIFSKKEQLELYLASVRFERGVYGALDAMNHFWRERVVNVSKAQAFFLIERVSNIYSLLLTDKIIQIVRQSIESEILSLDDVKELIELYGKAISSGKIKDQHNGLVRLDNLYKETQ